MKKLAGIKDPLIVALRPILIAAAITCPLLYTGCGDSSGGEEASVVGIWKTFGVAEHFELTEDGTLHFYDKVTDPPTMSGRYEISGGTSLTWILKPIGGGRESRETFEYEFPEDQDHLALRKKGRPWKTYERVER